MNFGVRSFSCSAVLCKKVSVNLKGRSKSSQDWLLRQIKDPYVEMAKRENYRCRSAFKLLEIDERYNLFQPGQIVVDCGAAPGSWTQIAVDKTNANGNDSTKPKGMVIGLDKLAIYPIRGAVLLGQFDFTREESREKLKNALDNKLADIVMSDMAPNATGVKSMDHDAIINLAYIFVRFGVTVSHTGSTLLLKLWEGSLSSKLEKDLQRLYDSVKWVKPKASRKDSSEVFLLAKGFKGLQS